MLREILVIFLLFLPVCQGKVCGYEVRWKSRTERVPFLQTVTCQTAGCPEVSPADLQIISHLRLSVGHSEGDPLDDQANSGEGGHPEMLPGLCGHNSQSG